MADNDSWLQEMHQDTHDIIEQLVKDGSDPDVVYEIEHHFSSADFDSLEKLAVEAFRLGYEITDPEEGEEGEERFFSCDAISESSLRVDMINAQVDQLFALAEKLGVEYDGWGTYFMGDEGDEGDEGEEYDDDDEDEDEER